MKRFTNLVLQNDGDIAVLVKDGGEPFSVYRDASEPKEFIKLFRVGEYVPFDVSLAYAKGIQGDA